MPIKAAQPILEATIFGALSLGPAANPATVAAMVMAGVGAAAAMGQQPVPFPVNFIPVVPAGVPVATQMFAAIMMSMPPDVAPVSTVMASAVAIVAPQVPPVGLPILQAQLDVSMRKGDAASEAVIAAEWSMAIIDYYVIAGIV
ncbi:MAG: hypothetical protein LC687_04130 [Actinobacteria bacterium]|nr:hypothetical protein [Actinomycetota bacterium]MCA1807023.1 hypothetical protein [Actinomycetota bacterium]